MKKSVKGRLVFDQPVEKDKFGNEKESKKIDEHITQVYLSIVKWSNEELWRNIAKK